MSNVAVAVSAMMLTSDGIRQRTLTKFISPVKEYGAIAHSILTKSSHNVLHQQQLQQEGPCNGQFKAYFYMLGYTEDFLDLLLILHLG